MADGFETIGWVLSVEDKATDRVKKIVSTMDDAVTEHAYTISRWNDQLTKMADETKGPLGLAIKTGRTFLNVFGDGFIELEDAFVRTFDKVSTGVVDFASGLGKRAAETFDGIVGKASGTIEGLKQLWENPPELTWGEMLAPPLEGARNIISEIREVIGEKMVRDWKLTLFWTRKFKTSINGVLQDFISMENVGLAFKKMGGIGGALLGPLAPLLKLLRPIIDLIAKQFTPAIETFTAIIEPAFAPFGEILEVIAQNIATKLVPYLKPLGSFLELMALKVGSFVGTLLDGKPEGIISAIGGTLSKMVPVAYQLFDAVGKIGKALVPLIPPLTQLTVVLLEKVMLPALQGFANWMEKYGVPFIEIYTPKISAWIESFSKDLSTFFSDLPGYASFAYDKFIKPIVGWIKEIGDMFGELIDNVKNLGGKAVEALGLDPDRLSGSLMGVLDGVMNSLGGLVDAPLESLKGGANKVIDAYNSLITADIPVIGALNKIEALRDFGVVKIPKLAEGGVVEGMRGEGVFSNLGEAGPELVLPLKEETVRDVLSPVLPELEMPALDDLVKVANSILTRLDAPIRVDTGEREQSRDPFANTAGMGGIGAW